MLTFPQVKQMSGWWPSSSAMSLTLLTNFKASLKLGNLKSLVILFKEELCSLPIINQLGTCFNMSLACLGDIGGVPISQGRHFLVDKSDMT